VLFSVAIQLTRRGLQHLDSRAATLVTIGTATLLYWAASPWLLEGHYWLSPAILLFAAIGLFRPFLSANLAMAGTRYLGPTVSSTLAATSPVFGVALGVVLLGERLGGAVAMGTLAIVSGVVALSWKGGEARTWPWWALALPMGAALLRSLAQALAKLGMETLPSPYFVGLVGYSVSFLVALAYHRRNPSGYASVVVSPGFKWMVSAGVLVGLAILALNSALNCGRLVVVAPIVACSPVFTMLLGLSLFRERSITRRVVLAVLLVVPGVVLITLRG
jgi:drug/metabolite transporter (DMT)-like permease